MDKKLKILHLEDMESDAELINRALLKGKLNFERLVVDSKPKFLKALTDFSPDIILSDHSLPSFNSHNALDIVLEMGMKIPFILITANISEEFAVDVIKRGADDYILKDRLKRLPTAIENSLQKFRLEREREESLNEIIRKEKYYRALIENGHDAILLVDKDSALLYQSPSVEHITGFTFDEVKNTKVAESVHPDDQELFSEVFSEVLLLPGMPITREHRIRHRNGHYIWIEGTVTNLLHDENVKACIMNYRDITKRKQAEESLKESEFRYRQIVETAQEGIWLLDENNRTTFVNQKMCNILEYSKEEMIGKESFYFMNEAGKLKSSASLERRRKGVIDDITAHYITKSGKDIWTKISGNPIFDKEGVYKGALGMVSDITEKKKLEDLLDKVNTQARIGNWEVDLQKSVLNWSAITNEIHETKVGDDIDIDSAINFYKEGFSRDSISAVLLDAMNRGIPWDLELIIVTAKSNERWVRVIGEAEFQNGKCIRLFGSIQDIDARKRAENEVLKVYEEKNIILESIGDAFFAIDKNWIITYWNKEAERLTGFAKSAVIGVSLHEVYPNRVNTDSFKKYVEAKDSNQVIHFETFNELVNRWYEISVYPANNGLSIYFRDVTDRKVNWIQLNELNNSLEKNARELAISNAELEQFAYVASHDLQEPLRMVTSFLSQIEKKYDRLFDDKGRQYIHFAVDGAKRMRQIILDLLEFSRVGRLDDNSQEVSVKELLDDDIIPLYRKEIEEKKAILKITHLPLIKTFKTPLRQVLQNLLSNALKYQQEGTPAVIEIDSIELKDSWQFSIKDNGIGIEAEYFQKIFVIFQRLHKKDEYAGTGMGLAICKKIIENMRGKIWVDSKPGEGSTFFFTLPKL